MLLIGFGDSITAGGFLPTEDTFVYKLGLKYGVEVLNAGVSGNTTSQALERMQTDVLDKSPDICIVEFGMNDHVAKAPDKQDVDPATFAANLKRMITELQAIKCIPILCTVSPIIEGSATEYYYRRHPEDWYRTPPGAQAWIDQYSQIVRDIAVEMNVRLADVAAAYADYLRNGGSLDGPAGVLRNLDNADADDGVHPSAGGHDLYLAAIAEQIDTIKFGC